MSFLKRARGIVCEPRRPASERLVALSYSTSCWSEVVLSDSACDSQAKQMCDKPPIRTNVTSQQNGSTYPYSVFYYCQ
jgi:hypothetical protein